MTMIDDEAIPTTEEWEDELYDAAVGPTNMTRYQTDEWLDPTAQSVV